MTENELISLYLASAQSLDSNFEFWLSMSFGLLIASYLLSEKVPRLVLIVTISLYFSATALFMLRGMTVGRTLTSLRDQLESMGSATAMITVGENTLVAALYFLIMIGGTVATVAFVYWRFRKLQSHGNT